MAGLILQGDARALPLADASVHCVVTSPPYWGLRDYGVDGQIGLESSIAPYVAEMVAVFTDVWRVLRDDGTCWVNLGDSYNAHPGQRKSTDKAGVKQSTNIGANGVDSRFVDTLKPKDLCGIPWRVAFALQDAGWYLRSDIIWAKPNPMPESVTDRPTKAHEYVFLLTKSERYYYDAEAIKEKASEQTRRAATFRNGGSYTGGTSFFNSTPKEKDSRGDGELGLGRNARSVWTIATSPFADAHFATFPPALVECCIKAGCPKAGIVLDPFSGSGTTPLVADRLGRHGLGLDLSLPYCSMAHTRLSADAPLFALCDSSAPPPCSPDQAALWE